MKRIQGLLRDTWWVWLPIFITCFILGIFVNPILFITVPMNIVAMVYFAIMRYDDDGNPVEE